MRTLRDRFRHPNRRAARRLERSGHRSLDHRESPQRFAGRCRGRTNAATKRRTSAGRFKAEAVNGAGAMGFASAGKASRPRATRDTAPRLIPPEIARIRGRPRRRLAALTGTGFPPIEPKFGGLQAKRGWVSLPDSSPSAPDAARGAVCAGEIDRRSDRLAERARQLRSRAGNNRRRARVD